MFLENRCLAMRGDTHTGIETEGGGSTKYAVEMGQAHGHTLQSP
jgi:hypothetical protein